MYRVWLSSLSLTNTDFFILTVYFLMKESLGNFSE